MIIIKGIKS
ncbi:hypothetical protein BsWGS_10951 [Bradybaena similaris]